VTVIVGYDGSDGSGRALVRAADEAREHHERLIVLAVFELPLDPNDPRNFGTPANEPRDGPLHAPPQIVEALDEARRDLASSHSDVTADYLWAPGEPGNLIVETAREQKARLIVVGTHHHGFLSRVFGADVAGDVRREADCEVLVVE
jgi:nucleotide-binding universal stress UspA family protein